jgi:hypothetical protein
VPIYTVTRSSTAVNALLDAAGSEWEPAELIQFGSDPWTTRFRALWTPAHLCLRFDVADRDPWHTMTTRDDRLWNEEVVEIFLDPDGARHHYAELEISPANVVCDLLVVRPWPDLESDSGWHIDALDTRVVPFRGEGAGSDGWSARAAIPWAGLRTLPVSAPLPPREGDRWRFNVYRIKRPHGPARPNDEVVYAAWSPTGGPSFHVPEAFGEMVFGG